jgi:rubrerythrin
MDTFRCVDCRKEFNSREELQSHRQSPCEHESQAKIFAPFQCRECAKEGKEHIAKNRRGLAIHLSATHGIRSQRRDAITKRMKAEMKKSVSQLLEPQPFNDKGKLEIPPQVQIYFCSKCAVLWDGRGKMSYCPDCGDLLKTPPKQKHFNIGGQ